MAVEVEAKFYVWLLRFEDTVSYLFTVASSVEEARLRIIEKTKEVKETTTECVHWSEGVEYRYKSSPIGAKEGALHLGGPDCMTSEEVCYQEEAIKKVIAGEPLFIANKDAVGIVTAAADSP